MACLVREEANKAINTYSQPDTQQLKVDALY